MTNFKLTPQYILGENSLQYLNEFLKIKNAKRILLIYGGGSIKNNGLYDEILKILNSLNILIYEISGLQPNPTDTSIWNGINKTNFFNPDFIIAAGGGSVIDASKIIGILIANRHFKSVEDYFDNEDSIKNLCPPIISIITLAGTASENNGGSVITFEKTKTKKSINTPSGVPVLVIEDPVYTYSVNKWQTASGSFDCFSHLLEQYYVQDLFDWTKEYLFSNMRNVLKYGPIAYDDPTNYNARKNLIFTTSMSLNSISSIETSGDWNVHIIEHAISGKWNVTHGAGLALLTPTYIKYRCAKDLWFKEKTILLGKEVFQVNGIDETIKAIENWIKKLNLPNCWSDFSEIKKIDKKDIEWLINHIMKNGGYLLEKDYENILKNIKF